MKIRRAVFIVTYSRVGKEIKYLILKRKLHWKGWEFPKGGVEFQKSKIFGDSPKLSRTKGGVERFELRRIAVKRELKEEIGLTPLKINSFKEKGVYRYEKEYADRKGFSGQNYKLYSAEVNFSKKIKMGRLEHSDFQWVSFNEAIKKLTWANQRKCLRIVNESLEHNK